MNTLLEGPNRIKYQGNLSWVFRALGERQCEFNWLLTDLECIGLPENLPYNPRYGNNKLWLSGKDLTEIVDFGHVQFIWGVLSGFPPNVELDLERLKPYPISEANRNLWRPNVQIQHPLAEVEIIFWDGYTTILLSRDEDLALSFRAFFPEAVDLDEYNRLRQNKV